MKRILIINSFERKGGAEDIYQKNIDTLSGKYEVYTASSEERKGTENHIRLNSYLDTDNKLLSILNYIFNFKNYFILRKKIKTLRIDVVFLHNFFGALSPSILMALKPTTKTAVFQVMHDYHVLCPNSSLYNYNNSEKCDSCISKRVKHDIFWKRCDRRGSVYSILKGIRSFISNNVLNHQRKIDKFICPSDFMASKLIKDGIDSQKVEIIRNPVDFDFTSKSLNTNSSVVNFVFFGRFSDEKNLFVIMKAFRNLSKKGVSNIHLNLIGEGELEKSLRRYVEDEGIGSIVSFKGFLPKNLLKLELAKSDYFILPSKCYENAPVSIVEAVCNGVYPISSNFGGMKEMTHILKIGHTFDSQNSNELESLIENTLKGEIDHVPVSLKVTIESLFSMDTYNRKIETLIENEGKL